MTNVQKSDRIKEYKGFKYSFELHIDDDENWIAHFATDCTGFARSIPHSVRETMTQASFEAHVDQAFAHRVVPHCLTRWRHEDLA